MARIRTQSLRTNPTQTSILKGATRKDAGGLTIRVRAVGFKPHPSPYPDDSAHQYSFKILANDELATAFGDDFFRTWVKINPREQRLDGPVMRDLERTWNDYPREFFRVNRGIVLSAESVTYDADTGYSTIRLSSPDKHGGVDGMHTLRKIVDELIQSGDISDDDDSDGNDTNNADDDLPSDSDADSTDTVVDRYLTCEVWVGLSTSQQVLLSQGRNTSRTVPPYGIMAIRGDFNALEIAIAKRNSEYCKQIAFKPNQHIEGLDGYRPISVLEVLQLMTALDIKHGSDRHPIEAYKNRAFGMHYFAPELDENGKTSNPRSRRDEYEKMFPLIGDFLHLYDLLRQVVPLAYDAAKTRPRYWTKVLAGKGRNKVNNKETDPLYYIDPTGATKTIPSPTSLFFPMFSAFRALLRHGNNGQYEWLDGIAPSAWPREEFFSVCQRLAIKVAKAATVKSSLHDVGRDQQVWDTCYETLNADLIANGRKRRPT